jgi:hypothetical protein
MTFVVLEALGARGVAQGTTELRGVGPPVGGCIPQSFTIQLFTGQFATGQPMTGIFCGPLTGCGERGDLPIKAFLFFTQNTGFPLLRVKPNGDVCHLLAYLSPQTPVGF